MCGTAVRSTCTIAQRIRNQLQRKCRGYGGGAFCPASAWITESRSRQIQLKFEVRFACSPQCSSLLQHVAHGRLHRWHCRQCCTWPIVALHFCLPPLNGKFKFISGFNCGNATTPTHIHSESGVCVRVTFVATSVPFPCPLELCLVMSLAPAQICQSSFVYEK